MRSLLYDHLAMDQRIIDDWVARVARERERTAPPKGFPPLPDIPGARYTDAAFYALEQRGLWQRSWLYAAHSDQLANPGDFVVWRHGSAPIVLICGDDGRIRAFYNTCRHRGAPVLLDESGHAASRLVCGYHGWTYDRQGQLRALSEARDWSGQEVLCKHLINVRCERYGNWVFVNEDDSAEPLLDFLAPVRRYIDHLPLSELKLINRRTFSVRANIKVLLENFLEAYHFNLLHAKTTHRIFDNRGTSVHLWANGHSMMLSPNRRDDWIDPGTTGMPEMDSATTIERDHNPSYCLFPNFIMPIAPSGMPCVAMWPDALDRSTLEVLWFAPGPQTEQDETLWQQRIANFERIVDEDIQFAEPIQDTLNSRGFTGVPLSYQERRIYHWHEALDKRIGVRQIPSALRVTPVLEAYVE